MSGQGCLWVRTSHKLTVRTMFGKNVALPMTPRTKKRRQPRRAIHYMHVPLRRRVYEHLRAYVREHDLYMVDVVTEAVKEVLMHRAGGDWKRTRPEEGRGDV